MRWTGALLDRGLLPDPLIRFGIRRLLDGRLKKEYAQALPDRGARIAEWKERLVRMPIALVPEAANRQHYEVPAELFAAVLGPHLKYSCGFWPPEVTALAEAEETMLDMSARRAQIKDGQRILDLGCGWGSFSLFVAERYPNCQLHAVSNSRSQGAFILAEAARRGLENIHHQVADINELQLDVEYDRVVSIEMFEHLRNYDAVLGRIASWLRPGGKLFVHVFCHKELTYPFEDNGAGDWMARYFFTGGIMPSTDLLPAFQEHLTLEEDWLISGVHYQKTSEAWLEQLDRARDEMLPVLEKTYGTGQGAMWLERWRIFFMACAELFGAQGGKEWMVAHYRFAR